MTPIIDILSFQNTCCLAYFSALVVGWLDRLRATDSDLRVNFEALSVKSGQTFILRTGGLIF
jgi:hypothetical protein